MYDLVISNAQIIDGSGRPAFHGALGIVGTRIVALSSADLSATATRNLDARGMAVTPGFIDAHTHDDLVVLRQATALPKIHQGITTLVIGNCGFGPAPTAPASVETLKSYSAAVLGADPEPWNWPTMGAFLQTLHTRPLGQHVRALLGHTALRVATMGFELRAASEQELRQQEALVAEAMQSGAAGLSLGLMYLPGLSAPLSELVRLARVTGQYGGVVTAHMRGEGETLLSSVTEMLRLAEEADVAVHISHLKITGSRNWGSIERALEKIAQARAHGLDITIDVYPYTAGSTTITQLLPPWILAGGLPALLERLRDPLQRQRVSQDLARGLPGWDNQAAANGWERIYLASLQQPANQPMAGLNLAEAAEQLGMSPEEAFFHLILTEEGQITIILFSMAESDVDSVVQSSFSMIGSDGLPATNGRPHPRLYGTFPRFLQRYVREQQSLTLEQAIHKVTAMPAARFQLTEQGEIAINKQADLVIFDPETICDLATYQQPQTYPQGIAAVIVAGQPVVLDGQDQGSTPGQLITSSMGTGRE